MTTLQTPPGNAPDLKGMQQSLGSRLMRLRSRVRLRIALDAIARALLVMLVMLSVSLVLDYWLELSRAMRGFYWLLTIAGGAHFLYHFGYKPLRTRLEPIALAHAVDIAQGNTGEKRLAPRVATVLQLPDMIGDDGVLSGQMIRDAVGRSFASLEQTDFAAALSGKHRMQCIGLLLAALIVPGIVGGAMSGVGEAVVGTWAQRWLMLNDVPYPRNTRIEILGLSEEGKLIIPAGENATLRARITTKDGREIEEARLLLRPQVGKPGTEPMTRFDAADFRIDLAPMTDPASAILRAGDQTLRFEIVPSARPRLTGVRIRYSHPADAPGTAPQQIDLSAAEGELSLLELSEVELLLTANVPIAQARYAVDAVESAEDLAKLPPIERSGPNTFTLRWTQHDRQRLRLELISEEAGLVSQPIPITVGLKTDRKPSVRLRSEGVGPRITPNALIPLNIEARDDFGLLSADITPVRVRTGEEQAGEKTFDTVSLYADEKARELEFRGKHQLEVDSLEVVPNDVIRLTGLASDNRYVGSQTGESTVLTFRIVTHKELFREIIARQQQARAAFRQAIEDSKDVHVDLLKAENGSLAAAQSRRFRAIQREVWKVGRELERSAEEMRLNRLGGSKEEGNQTYESMKATILDPLEHLHDQTMSRQRDAIERAGVLDANGLKNLAADQQAVVDEMTDLLLRMNRWDELLDAINQLTEVIDQQEQLMEKLNELIENEIDNLFE